MSESNEIVKYSTSFGEVELSPEVVQNYLVRGNSQLTPQEMKLGLELCKFQKLNPFTGEVYFIKFGNDFQLVVGYEAYKRRAEENPEYLNRKSGIVVVRGNEILQKEGTCLYPTETLIGGWCRVYRIRNGEKVEIYKEVSLVEYQKMKEGKPCSNWATKPCTMIEKVAVSQALRAAFPKDYEGLYVPEEFHNSTEENQQFSTERGIVIEQPDKAAVITAEQRQQMFDFAHASFGKDEGNNMIKAMISEHGIESTVNMPVQIFEVIMQQLHEAAGNTESMG